MKVTDEMARRAAWARCEHVDPDGLTAMRMALEAALADVPDLEDIAQWRQQARNRTETAVRWKQHADALETQLATLRAEIKKLAEEWRTQGRTLEHHAAGATILYGIGATLLDSADILERRLLGDP